MIEQERVGAHMSEIEKPMLPSTIPEIRCSMCQSSTKILSTAMARMASSTGRFAAQVAVISTKFR